jgi:DNA (cytosine-5)-methyltransferase 1
MKLLAVTPLGRNRETSRLWIETRRLEALGFPPGTPFSVETKAEELLLKPAVLAENHVSSRAVSGGRRPIIDLANQVYLRGLTEFPELKITGWFERIRVTPSRRAAAILRSRRLAPPYRVVEAFSGGGTMTAALSGNEHFRVEAGIEIEPSFADEWQAAHPNAALVQADIRAVESSDLPEFDILIGGIPCTSHSNLGRAKKGLAGKPELGDTGDLFIPVLSLVRDRMPVAVVFENVPSFGTSLAGQVVVTHLERLGYNVFTTILKPNEEWGEIEDRQRWVLVATLNRPFELRIPDVPCMTPVSTFLDPPEPTGDEADAGRIAVTIEGLRAHAERHRVLGHGFGFSVLDGSETKLPVIPKCYHKINSGPFLQTPFGPRLLRLHELERIRGHKLLTEHYATGVEILGQGVLTRVFRTIFRQLEAHLCSRDTSVTDSAAVLPRIPQQVRNLAE